MNQKPTADECLDVLSLIWHRCAPGDLEDLLMEMDRDIPGWHTRMQKIAGDISKVDVEAMYRVYAWRKCRELLLRSKHLRQVK